MPIIASPFKPAWWLKNPHLQTLWPTFFRRSPNVDIMHHRLELDDGDFLDLAFSGLGNKQNPHTKPIVVILHGLEGSLESHYIKPLIKALDQNGFAACFVHFRGCSEEINRLPRSYHSGDTNDLQRVIDYLIKTYNQGVFAVIGFSLGGNVVLKWMGEQADNAPVQTAIAVSVPFQLAHAGERLEKSFSRVYQKHLLSSCQQKYNHKFKEQACPLDVDANKLKTFYQFDDRITAPLHGFKGADDYYQQCSSRQFLSHIHKPTLILHAKDDPFMWEHTIPDAEELSPSVQLELSSRGGHVGFISGKIPFMAEYWLDDRIIQWLKEQQYHQEQEQHHT